MHLRRLWPEAPFLCVCGVMRAVAAALAQANRCVFTGELKTRSSEVRHDRRYRGKTYTQFDYNSQWAWLIAA